MSTALPTLLEQAENERDAALARMLQSDDAVRQGRAQAEQLHAYREDYRKRAPALHGKAASIELVRCHQGFMQRLDQAIEQQRGQLAALERQAAALREVLLEREVRVAAVKKLIERRADEAGRRATRLDQRHADEVAQRLAMQASGFGALTRRH
ncbi:MAG: flagellar export protein FliJ [Rubrivivax sp.]|nr:flagellar export protein FliJ [Rubrivivax sp.]